jgi:hypothetical protein
MTTPPRSIRFPEGMQAQGEEIARVRGISFNRLVVDLLEAEIDRVRTDPKFVAQVEQLIESNRGILDRLAER